MDRALIERAQRGDRDAYAEVATRSSDRLYAVALRILRDPDAASDALQSSLVLIWRDLPTLRDPDLYEGWSYRILVNACGGVRRAHRVVLSINVVGVDVPAPDEASHVAVRDEVERAFTTLTVGQRSILVLRYYRDMSVEDIATMLEVSVGTVKSRLHAARRAMRAAIEAEGRLPARQERPA